MRILLTTFVLAAAVAVSAPAATVDPKALVIRPADVPTGYTVVREESGLRTNALEARESPATRGVFRRWGRVTGYQVIFERGELTIEARADVFRAPAGARGMLRWADRQARLAGVQGLRRARARIGAEGWTYTGGVPPSETYVFWRYGRVWSALGGRGMSRPKALDLARAQQRRIARALR